MFASVERYRAGLFGGNARRGKVEAAGARKSGDLLQTQRPANVDKGTFLRNPLKSVPGVKETPRSTSPNLAPVTPMNGVIAANDGSVFAALSTTTTRRFGSAPVSPFPLTVEVIAQMATKPSGPFSPVMLRKPSVAGAQGKWVAGLLPVG